MVIQILIPLIFLICIELPGTGVLEETLGGGLQLAYPIYNQNLRFSLSYVYDLTKDLIPYLDLNLESPPSFRPALQLCLDL